MSEKRIYGFPLYKETSILPDLPPVGYWKIYPRSGSWYLLDSGGVETQLGASPVHAYKVTFTPGTAGSPNTITHNLGTTDIIVQLWDVTVGDAILTKLDNRTTNTVDVTFSVNPAGDVRIVILAAV
jgi:hypothetical protein